MSDAYDTLRSILDEAAAQASNGKGQERHSLGEAFEDQPIMRITREVGLGFPVGQALKKIGEAKRMADRHERERAAFELLGAVNYLAAAVMHLRGAKL